MIFTSDGKLYSLDLDLLPGGKSNGTNLSFFVNLKNFSKIVGISKYEKNFKCLLISHLSKGFIFIKIPQMSIINKNLISRRTVLDIPDPRLA